MALIPLPKAQGESYRNYLQSYREKFGREPGPIERTEAFFLCKKF